MINEDNHLIECEVGRSLRKKFDTFLEEGLLDPLLPYIIKDAERDIDFKVEYLIFFIFVRFLSSCTTMSMMSQIITEISNQENPK